MDNILQASIIPNFCGSHSNTRNSCNDNDNKQATIGGYFADGSLCWFAKGSTLTVICHQTSKILSYKDFQNILCDDNIWNVVSCKEYGNRLIVGLNSESGIGLLCLYNHNICKVIKSIYIPHLITCFEVVLEEGGATHLSKPFASNLRWFFGVVAVGTVYGHIYLVDLRLDDNAVFGDELAANIEVVPTVVRDIPQMRNNFYRSRSHLAFNLLDHCHEEDEFHYITPDDRIVKSYAASEVSVTSLFFEPRCISLFAGLSFGQFHIFNLKELVLSFSSQIHDLQSPVSAVSHFVFQEPENDPKHFCYLWVVQSTSNEKNNESAMHGTMYQVIFNKKELLKQGKQLKSFYTGLECCNPRFHIGFDETFGLGPSPGDCNILQCSSIERYNPFSKACSEDDYSSTPYISVFLCAWVTTKDNCQTAHLLIFDINSWYVAHMPSSCRGFSDDEMYLVLWSLNPAVTESDGELLALYATPSSLHHFFSKSHPTPRQFTYPSSYSFRANCLTTTRNITCKLSGVQDQTVEFLLDARSEPLVFPDTIFNQMINVGLIDLCLGDFLTIDQKREAILSAALNHDIFVYLSHVITELSTGKHAASGCTLRFVLEWAWKQTAIIKEAIDNLCVTIFDCTVVTLDTTSQDLLSRYITQLGNLHLIFKKLNQAEAVSQLSQLELDVKNSVICLIMDYLKILRWFIGARLLPEQLDDHLSFELDSFEEFHFIYKQKELRATYEERRAEMKEINRSPESSLLIIDGLLEEAGNGLLEQWKTTDPDSPTKYPPPSLYALLSMYFLDNVEEYLKHTITTYFLLDILAVAEASMDNAKSSEVYEATYNDHRQTVSYFPQTFQLPPSHTKLIKAFWLLDHCQFQESCYTFCESGTERVTSAWQHRRILQAYLMQDQADFALQYFVAQQPITTCLDDVKLHLDVLIKNKKLQHALKLAQVKADARNKEAIYTHLFTVCYKTDSLHELLKFTISKEEEMLVNSFLKSSSIPHSHDILVLHMLRRSHFVEAIQLYQQYKKTNIMAKQGEVVKGYHSTLSSIIQGYIHYLPDPLKDYALTLHKPAQKIALTRKEMPSVQPLSAVVNSTKKTAPLSHSSLLSLNMGRIKKLDPVLPLTPFKQRPAISSPDNSQNVNTSLRFFPTDLQLVTSAKKSSRRSLAKLSLSRSSFGASLESPIPYRSSQASSPPLPLMSINEINKRKTALMEAASIILQTPPIQRNVKKATSDVSMLDAMTPQSILKVKMFREKTSIMDSPSSNSNQFLSPFPGTVGSLPGSGSHSKLLVRDQGLDSSGSECVTPEWMPSSVLSSRKKHTSKLSVDMSFNIDTPPVNRVRSISGIKDVSFGIETPASTKRLRFRDLLSTDNVDRNKRYKAVKSVFSKNNSVVKETDENSFIDVEGDVLGHLNDRKNKDIKTKENSRMFDLNKTPTSEMHGNHHLDDAEKISRDPQLNDDVSSSPFVSVNIGVLEEDVGTVLSKTVDKPSEKAVINASQFSVNNVQSDDVNEANGDVINSPKDLQDEEVIKSGLKEQFTNIKDVVDVNLIHENYSQNAVNIHQPVPHNQENNKCDTSSDKTDNIVLQFSDSSDHLEEDDGEIMFPEEEVEEVVEISSDEDASIVNNDVNFSAPTISLNLIPSPRASIKNSEMLVPCNNMNVYENPVEIFNTVNDVGSEDGSNVDPLNELKVSTSAISHFQPLDIESDKTNDSVTVQEDNQQKEVQLITLRSEDKDLQEDEHYLLQGEISDVDQKIKDDISHARVKVQESQDPPVISQSLLQYLGIQQKEEKASVAEAVPDMTLISTDETNTNSQMVLEKKSETSPFIIQNVLQEVTKEKVITQISESQADEKKIQEVDTNNSNSSSQNKPPSPRTDLAQDNIPNAIFPNPSGAILESVLSVKESLTMNVAEMKETLLLKTEPRSTPSMNTRGSKVSKHQREDPVFLLSPPTTRSGRRRAATSAKRETPSRKRKGSNVDQTVSASPNFIFSPPTSIRTRSQRKRKLVASPDQENKAKKLQIDAVEVKTPTRSSKRQMVQKSSSETLIKKEQEQGRKVLKSKSDASLRSVKEPLIEEFIEDKQTLPITGTSSRQRSKRHRFDKKESEFQGEAEKDNQVSKDPTDEMHPTFVPHPSAASPGLLQRLRKSPATSARKSSRLKTLAKASPQSLAKKLVKNSLRSSSVIMQEAATEENASVIQNKRLKTVDADIKNASTVETRSSKKKLVSTSRKKGSRASSKSRVKSNKSTAASLITMNELVTDNAGRADVSVANDEIKPSTISTRSKSHNQKYLFPQSNLKQNSFDDKIRKTEITPALLSTSPMKPSSSLKIVSSSWSTAQSADNVITASKMVIYPITSRRRAKVGQYIRDKSERKNKK